MFDEKLRGANVVKIKHSYTIEKLLKHIYIKWSHIFYLRLWAKSYEEKRVECQIFKCLSFPCEKGRQKDDSVAQGKRGVGNLTLDFIFGEFNFLFIITNEECKTI